MSTAFDPFDEMPVRLQRRCYRLLGHRVCVESEHTELLELAEAAFAGNGHREAAVSNTPRVRLLLAGDPPVRAWRRPPVPRHFSGPGLVGCSFDAANFAWVTPALATGCVSISREMLRFPYHARYELIEFAVLTLLTRMHELVPLHAACVAVPGRAVLLVGDSGAGKSTTCLQALDDGMSLISEDSVFVHPGTLAAAGLDAFLHLRSGRFAHDRFTQALRGAPRIRRRSGVRKIELDIRELGLGCARQPVRLAAIVMVSRRPAGRGAVLRRLSARQIRGTLAATQPYARRQAGWREFCARASKLPVYEMRRVLPPQAVENLRHILLPGGAGS